jgi:hypothetical protein
VRLAWVEAGPPDGEPVLLRGEPSWSFVYRTAMAVLAEAMPEAWLRFREVVRTAAKLSVSRLVQSGCQDKLSSAVLYDAEQ